MWMMLLNLGPVVKRASVCNLYHADPFVVASAETAHEWAIWLNKLCSLNLTPNPRSNVKWKIKNFFNLKNYLSNVNK